VARESRPRDIPGREEGRAGEELEREEEKERERGEKQEQSKWRLY
jgi:hypothetical protein